ncbi:collagen alpha-1(I) chain-like [Anomalospiza imberbis]|uniref:collagen alpha-1(I) chain-like n=1 Tax=Anomalospiza imberbis TaxID=187417 RepID=UPI00358EF4CA
MGWERSWGGDVPGESGQGGKVVAQRRRNSKGAQGKVPRYGGSLGMVGRSCPRGALWGRSWPGGAGGGSGQGLRRRVGNPGRLRPVPAGCCQETGTHSLVRPAPASSLPAPELAGHRAGCARGGSPVPREEEHSWAQLPGSRPRPGHWSSSSSICTEDFAASFWEGMVEPLLCQQEPAEDVPTAGAHPGQDEPSLPTGRSLAMATEPGRAPWQGRSPSRSSLESLGARISRLSQSHGRVAWGVPWPGPPAQPALGHRGSPRGELLATALPGHSWRAAGIAAGRSSAGARTGSPGSSVPRASSARTRAHPALEPPALWGRGGNVTFTTADADRKGAASSRSAGTAVGAPGRWGSPVSPGLHGDQKGGLPCKGVAGQPLRWSLWRSWEGTRELGSGAKPWSQGDRARTGLALLGHTWDTHHRCHTDLQRMSWQGQGARVGQERLDKERRKAATSQEEKLELLERLRELERGSRSLLRQRLLVLHRLHGLLQRDKAETLRQLQEALEQVRDGRRERSPDVLLR